MAKLPTHKWTPNTPDIVTLQYDTPFENKKDDGVYYTYTVSVNGEDKYAYASPDLHRLIQATNAKKGDTVSVTKYMEGSKFSSWSVTKDDYISVKQGDAPMRTNTPQKPVSDNAPDWDAIERRKQLNIISGQSMNLAVNTVLSLMNETDKDIMSKADKWDSKQVNDFYKLVEVTHNRFYNMLASMNLYDPQVEPQPANETTKPSQDDKVDDLPF